MAPPHTAMQGLARFTLALLLLHLAACSSLQTVRVDTTRTPPAAVHPGDEVRVTTRAGDRMEYRVTDVTEEGLGGTSLFVPWPEISRLEVRRPGANEHTTQIILGLIGLAAFIALINSADSVSVCSPGPCPTR